MGIINAIIDGFGDILSSVVMLLPPSPFLAISGVDSQILNGVNMLFPVNAAVAHLELFVSAVLVYYSLRTILRWTKAIGD